MISNNISGVILAGGSGKRFHGISKANITISGKSIISRIIETIRDVFDEIIIVTNTPDEFACYPDIKIVSDKFLNIGPLGGIHAAMTVSSKEALFVFAGDMPLLDKKLINRQIDLFCKNEYDILVPRFNQLIEPLHSIFNKSLINVLEEYLKEDRDFGVRDFFKQVNVSYFQIDNVDKARNAFININSPNDISIAEKILQSRRSKLDPDGTFLKA